MKQKWKLVPVEPTAAMREAWANTQPFDSVDLFSEEWSNVLAAAPAQSEQPDPIIAAKDVLLAAIKAAGPKAHFAAGEVFGLADLARKLGMHPHGSMLDALKAEQQCEPGPSCDPADICAGCRCKYSSSKWQAEQQGMCEHYDFKSSCQECGKAEQQGDGGAIGTVHVDSTCRNGVHEVSEPVLELSREFEAKLDSMPGTKVEIYTYPASEQPSARVALSEEQILKIGYRHFKPGHNVKAEANFVAAVRDVLAASAAQTGGSK